MHKDCCVFSLVLKPFTSIISSLVSLNQPRICYKENTQDLALASSLMKILYAGKLLSWQDINQTQQLFMHQTLKTLIYCLCFKTMTQYNFL
mmetsp:Transcript_39792/g.93241  ORF Transcript_39792/g.93241 Transcript_39792/m.93241 type:complete len:91 (+) Transcript_39792:416-688(+)